MDGQLNSVLNAKAAWQANTVFLTFNSSNIPHFAMGAETAINFFDFTLTNATTGEYIKVTVPCILNTDLIIDCENKKAYLEDGAVVNVILSSSRESWLDLEPGINNLNYVDVGTAAVHINIQHRDRIL
jgi:phage-related protein